MANKIFEEILKVTGTNRNAALCTVIFTKGSVPRHVGTKMLVHENMSIVGTIGGGALEKSVIEDALKIIKTKKPELFKHDLLQHHGMCCGGYMEIFIEPIMSNKKLYIFGAGHTGQALAGFALNLDFEIFLIDDRKEYLEPVENNNIFKMNLKYDKALKALKFDENTFIVIATYDHKLDREILMYCVNQPFAYLGMIGSERKIKLTRKMFINGGLIAKQDLDKVHMPIGIDIFAESPQEIAISILAEIIKTKNQI